jgi:TonB-linked SusC/RagA family outer membrane protein
MDGKKLSTLTDDKGDFALRGVPTGTRLLTVKLFGYKPVRQPVTVVENRQAAVRIVLVPTATVLSGVVTTAAGQQRRVEVGNDITVLNADSIVKVAPITTLTDMLATRVPGLIVQNTSGIPGAPSRIRIRGTSSITTSNDPILIVDGIRVNADQSGNTTNNGVLTSGGGSNVVVRNPISPGDAGVTYAGPSALDQIDPNSIEKIEVLKGPSATAIYGSDAANGVIIVTTKRGRGGPTLWSFTAGQQRTSLPGDWPSFYHTFYRPTEGGVAHEENFIGQGVHPTGTLTSNIPFQALNDSRLSPLGTGSKRDASLTVSGGSGPLSYSVTGTAANQTGYLHLPSFVAAAFQGVHGFAAPHWMIDPDTYSTYSGRSSIVSQIGTRGTTVALTSSVFRSAQQQSSLQGVVASLQFQYVDTSMLAEPWTASALASSLFPNYATRVQLNTTTFNNALTLTNWAPVRWLPSLNATAGLSVVNQSNNSLTPRDYILNGTADSLGQYSLNRSTIETQTLNASTNVLNGHLLSTGIGLNVVATGLENFSASTVGLPIGVSAPVSLLYVNGGPSQSSVHASTYGWYLTPTLKLNNRLYLNPGVRFDGGTASGNSKQLDLFPKVDVSYIAIDRSPSEPVFGLTRLRPRIAFGIAGIQPSVGQQLRLLQPSELVQLGAGGTSTSVGTLTVQTLGNTQLRPERSRELEGGVDAELWNQKFTISLTGYDKTRYDAILSVPVAPSVAVPGIDNSSGSQALNYWVNVGTIRNRGAEATISARLLETRAVAWSMDANISRVNNVVVHLNNGLQSITTSGVAIEGYINRIIAGYPLNGLWTRPIVGYADVNGDGYISQDEIRVGDDTVYLGAPDPNYEMTLSTNLSLLNGQLKINTSVDYINGLTQVLQSGNLRGPGNVTGSGGMIALAANDPRVTLAQQAAYIAASGGLSAIGVAQTVNALRWNTLAVSYRMPSAVLRALRVPLMSLIAQGSNLALRTNYRGKDPNVNAYSNGNLTQDSGQLPQPRTWSLRVRIGS